MINLVPLADEYTIYQLTVDQTIPAEIFDTGFYSVTRTGEEISIVTSGKLDLKHVKSNSGWKGFKVDGILDFSMIGVISDITKPLKDSQISVFIISTFNTDYIFVKRELFDRAIEILKSTENIDIK